ncbi:14365_t:CDS:2, partial [Gigaspora margarita]
MTNSTISNDDTNDEIYYDTSRNDNTDSESSPPTNDEIHYQQG